MKSQVKPRVKSRVKPPNDITLVKLIHAKGFAWQIKKNLHIIFFFTGHNYTNFSRTFDTARGAANKIKKIRVAVTLVGYNFLTTIEKSNRLTRPFLSFFKTHSILKFIKNVTVDTLKINLHTNRKTPDTRVLFKILVIIFTIERQPFGMGLFKAKA